MFSCVMYLYAPANTTNIHRLTSFLLAILRVHFKKESNANTLHIRGILSKLMDSSTLAPPCLRSALNLGNISLQRGRKRKNSWGKQEKNKWRREESKWETTAAGGANRSDTIRRNQRITGESSGK